MLPTDIILKQILQLPYKDIVNLCAVDRQEVRTVCQENEDWIYNKLLQRDFKLRSAKKYVQVFDNDGKKIS